VKFFVLLKLEIGYVIIFFLWLVALKLCKLNIKPAAAGAATRRTTAPKRKKRMILQQKKPAIKVCLYVVPKRRWF